MVSNKKPQARQFMNLFNNVPKPPGPDAPAIDIAALDQHWESLSPEEQDRIIKEIDKLRKG